MCEKCALPFQHQEALIGDPIDFRQMFQSGRLLSLRLFQTAVEEMFVMGDCVVPVFVEGPQQLLQAFLNAVHLKNM